MRNNIQEVALPGAQFEPVYRTHCGIGREFQNLKGEIVGKIEDVVRVAPAVGQIVRTGSRSRPLFSLRRF